MKISKDVDTLIKNNYKGSIISFEEDIGRFFSVKRILKKHNIKDTLYNSEKNIKVMANHIFILFNLFDEDVTHQVFEQVLDEDEHRLYQSMIFAMGRSKSSVNAEFETFLMENLKE